MKVRDSRSRSGTQNQSHSSKIDAAGVRKLVENKTDKYRVINVWATWCVPCVNELPELVTINRMYRKRPFEMITISMDSPEAMDQSAKNAAGQTCGSHQLHIRFRMIANALADALDKEWKGPVPYTLLVAPGGKIIYRKLNSLEPLELKRAIVEQLGRTYK